jgi:hypothetical protein
MATGGASKILARKGGVVAARALLLVEMSRVRPELESEAAR